MGCYNLSGQDTNTAATTVLAVNQPASALKRLRIYFASVGSDASADTAAETVLQRITTVGTVGSAVTPTPLDPADGAASAVAGQAHSAEPTYTSGAICLSFFGHQRANLQWYAPPGGEIVVPATNNAGIGVLSITAASAFNMGAVLQFQE